MNRFVFQAPLHSRSFPEFVKNVCHEYFDYAKERNGWLEQDSFTNQAGGGIEIVLGNFIVSVSKYTENIQYNYSGSFKSDKSYLVNTDESNVWIPVFRSYGTKSYHAYYDERFPDKEWAKNHNNYNNSKEDIVILLNNLHIITTYSLFI